MTISPSTTECKQSSPSRLRRRSRDKTVFVTAKQLSELKSFTMNGENVAHELVTAEWGLTWRPLPPVGVYPGPLGLNRHPNPVAWIEQMPKSFTGRWLPPQRCALRELLFARVVSMWMLD